MNTVIYFVRHAEAENPEKITYGRMPGFHLSETGKSQAQKTGEYLADKGIVAIYTSPLERCFETANIISEALPKDIHITHLYELIEVDASGWQSLTWEQVLKNESYERFISDPKADLPTENLSQMASRMVQIATALAKKHAGGAIVCVSHEFPIQALKLKLQNKPLENLPHIDDVAVASVTKLVLDEKGSLTQTDYIEPANQQAD